MKSNKYLILGALLLLLTATLAACGDNTATTGPAAAPTTAAMTTPMTSMPAMTTAAMTSMAAMTTAAPTTAAMTTPAATTASMTQAASGKTMEITISNFKFSPDTITIPAGTKVIWTNKDSVGHTITSDETGGPLKSGLIDQNKTFEYTFDKAGTYAYHCTPHPFMMGKIIVQ